MTTPGSPRTRAVVLLTGMSGTGKSSVLEELARRGHRVVDTDDPGWVSRAPSVEGTEPLWDLERVRSLLRGHTRGYLFVAGCVRNQGVLYDHFDQVVLLSAPLEVVLARVAERANPFGSTPEDRAAIAGDLAAFEPVLRARADHEIVTTAPLSVVADDVERLAAVVATST